MGRIRRIKESLSRVFDGSLDAKQWENYAEYTIIGLIVLSTVAVFASTFDVSPLCEKVLNFIDVFTIIFFTIEVSLRIWCADLLNDKYKGFWGRVRYCLSFYGLIDILSTYTFYVSLFIPLPYAVLKSLRVIRLLRVFRYLRSFRMLREAFVSKAKEMFISLQVLIIVTLMLSFALYFYEHAAQPEVYNNGLRSVIWAFAQYVRNPGLTSAMPITLEGRIIAFFVGLLGVALFAVPSGLVGAGFSEAMKRDRQKEVIKKNEEKLRLAFESKLDRPTGFQVVPQYLSVCDIQARMGIKPDDIFDAVAASSEFRLINLAVTQTVDEHPQDRLAVEHFVVNRPYGCCIDRGSKITIVSPTSLIDPCMGYFSYYIAWIGGFNYISREVGELRPYKSYYSFEDINHEENLSLYMEDLEKLTSREGSWTLTILAASGANEPTYPTVFHFSAGGAKGDERFEGDNLIVKDMQAYRSFYGDVAAVLEKEFNMTSDHQRYHSVNSPDIFARKYEVGKGCDNNIVLRVAWSACLWDSRRIAIAKTIADVLNKHFESDAVKEYAPELTGKAIGY